MGFWTNKEHCTAFDEAEDLAYSPTGGRIKMWLLGVGLAIIPIVYGVHCLHAGHVMLFGRRSDLDVAGSGAVALAIAYIAVGVFIHAHWFWGLQPKFDVLSYLLKILSVLIFLGSFGFAIYRIIVT
jgi:hypothetical protein